MLKTQQNIASFDFDNTLYEGYLSRPRLAIIQELFDYYRNGYKIIIVTVRHHSERAEIDEFILEHKLPVQEIYFTNLTPKGPLLKQLNVEIHFDDCPDQLISTTLHGITAVNILEI